MENDFFICSCSGLVDTDVNSGCVAQLVDGIEWIKKCIRNISAVIQILRQNKLWRCTNHALHFFFLPLKLVAFDCFILGLPFILEVLFGEK